MKTLKVVCTAMVLALVLSVPAYAGDISTPGVSAPVPVTNSPEPGDIDMPGVKTETSGSLDSVALLEILLTLVF